MLRRAVHSRTALGDARPEDLRLDVLMLLCICVVCGLLGVLRGVRVLGPQLIYLRFGLRGNVLSLGMRRLEHIGCLVLYAVQFGNRVCCLGLRVVAFLACPYALRACMLRGLSQTPCNALGVANGAALVGVGCSRAGVASRAVGSIGSNSSLRT